MAAKGTTQAERDADDERTKTKAERDAEEKLRKETEQRDKARRDIQLKNVTPAARAAAEEAVEDAMAEAELEGRTLTDEEKAKIEMDAVGKVDPGMKPPVAQEGTPGASATNPYLMRNDANPEEVELKGTGGPVPKEEPPPATSKR